MEKGAISKRKKKGTFEVSQKPEDGHVSIVPCTNHPPQAAPPLDIFQWFLQVIPLVPSLRLPSSVCFIVILYRVNASRTIQVYMEPCFFFLFLFFFLCFSLIKGKPTVNDVLAQANHCKLSDVISCLLVRRLLRKNAKYCRGSIIIYFVKFSWIYILGLVNASLWWSSNLFFCHLEWTRFIWNKNNIFDAVKYKPLKRDFDLCCVVLSPVWSPPPRVKEATHIILQAAAAG